MEGSRTVPLVAEVRSGSQSEIDTENLRQSVSESDGPTDELRQDVPEQQEVISETSRRYPDRNRKPSNYLDFS